MITINLLKGFQYPVKSKYNERYGMDLRDLFGDFLKLLVPVLYIVQFVIDMLILYAIYHFAVKYW